MTGLPPPRAVVNRAVEHTLVRPPGGHEVTEFHRRLRGYKPTPLHNMADVAEQLGVGGVFVKDESDRFGLPAFKILGATWAVAQALRARPDIRTLVAASSGNHGRAVARVAAQWDLDCRIYLPAVTSETRADLIRNEGAQVVRIDGSYDDAVVQAELAAEQPDVLLMADTAAEEVSESASAEIDGYSTLFCEVVEQSPVPFDTVLVPAGVGALTAAAVRWFTHNQAKTAVVAVEPVTAACVTASLQAGEIVSVPTPGTTMSGLDCSTPSANAWPTLRAGLTGAICVSDSEAHEAMRDFARRGLTIGDCGAATLAALRALTGDDACSELRAAIELSPTTNVLLVATEGASDPASYQAALLRRP